MDLRQRYLKVVSGLVAAGAVGAAATLGSALPAAASDLRFPVSQPYGVSERLAAVREAVFATVEPESGPLRDDDVELAWGNRWGNWGRRPSWRRPRWSNWRNGWPNWHNGWRNW